MLSLIKTENCFKIFTVYSIPNIVELFYDLCIVMKGDGECNDQWSQDQQKALEQALAQFPKVRIGVSTAL